MRQRDSQRQRDDGQRGPRHSAFGIQHSSLTAGRNHPGPTKCPLLS
jgi:hypothetical protein